ncbi:MAG TPA: Wzz/FepE/Etk N-terminal domain-containing protein [Legionella sp.]|nr:Wzz/FepE/Etk N-terminal domain-containing protein [Legionella sp.]
MHNEIGSPRASLIDSSIILYNVDNDDFKMIDLKKLFSELYKKSWLLLSFTLFFALLSFAFTITLKPQFRISTHLEEPTVNDFKDLYVNSGSQLNQSELFNLFVKKLANPQNFTSFISQYSQKNRALDESSFKSDGLSYDAMHLKSRVKINENQGRLREYQLNPNKMMDNGIDADLIIMSPSDIAKSDLNQRYLDYTNNKLINEIAIKQHDLVNIQTTNLEQLIMNQVKILKNKHLFLMERLRSQIQEAHKDPVRYKAQLSLLQNRLLKEQIYIDMLSGDNKSINQIIDDRENVTLQRLKNLNFDLAHVKTFNAPSAPNTETIYPNKKIFIIAGAFFGFLAGLSLIILQMGFRTKKESK